jgi:hypothetical protein
MRGQFNDTQTNGKHTDNEDDLLYQYRIRLKASADLGSGYYFKALVQNEEVPGSWVTVAAGNTEKFQLEVSNFIFGRMMENSHWTLGRLPLNSYNNPIFDLTLYPVPVRAAGSSSPITNSSAYAVDVPVYTYNFDRVFGGNYGRKIGPGELNASLIVFDNGIGDNGDALNGIKGNGLFNDAYALHLVYKTHIGDVTIDPQAIISLTDGNGGTYQNVAPNTFGTNVSIPAGNAKIGLSGFYTFCNDNNGRTGLTSTSTGSLADVNYDGYLFRVKGEVGPFMAWVDYNQTDDNTKGTAANYDNLFIWAQYNFKIYESATGTFSLTPTIRYRSSGQEMNGSEYDTSQLRTELYATVTF